MKKILGFFKFFLLAFLLVFGIRHWYENLSESKKRSIDNFIRQIPDLPGRYSI